MVGRSSKVYFTTENSSREVLNMDIHGEPPEAHELDRLNSTLGPAAPTQETSDTLNRTLHQCARDGNVKDMKDLLSFLGDRKRRMINKVDSNKMTPLHYASRYNHYHIARLLIENGAIVNYRGEDNQTPLHFAAKYKGKAAIKKTVTMEANIDEAGGEGDHGDAGITNGDESDQDDRDSNSPMLDPDLGQYTNGKATIAIGEDDERPNPIPKSPSQAFEYKAVEAVQKIDPKTYEVSSESVIGYMVANGGDPNARDIYGSTPLHFAAMRDNDVGLMDLLCQNGIEIEAVDKQRMTPLHLAATHDNKEGCRLLIENGAKLRTVDDENQSALHMAATEGNMDIIVMLLEEAERRDGWVTIQNMVTDADNDGNTPLHLAISNGHYDVVKLFLQKNANVNKACANFVTPLHLACSSGDLRIVQLLVESNARVNALDADQASPLHRATKGNHDDIIAYLVGKGALLERADKDNFTPLLIAASEGHCESLKTLIKLGANLTVTDRDEKTAVYWACEENQPEAVKVLLGNKVGQTLVDNEDRYGNQPLHIACRDGNLECAQLLLDAGAYIDEKNDEEKTPLHLAAERGMTHVVKYIGKRDKSTINNYDENSNSPLHLAALAGHNKVAAALLEMEADIVARNCNLWTPIDCAAAMGHVKMIKILLDADSPVDPTDRGKTTPLHLASMRGHSDAVKMLITSGASVQNKTSDNFNVMDLAIDGGHKDVVRVILTSDKWMDAMKHAHLDLNADGIRTTPTRKLIKKMPDMAEELFHRCTTSNGMSPESEKYAVTFNYELLDDQYASWDQLDGSSRSGESSSFFEGSVYGDDNKVKDEAEAYSKSKGLIKKNHPLMIMVRSQREDLLEHPLVTSLLRHKWHTVGRYFYYFNLIVYSVYLIFITAFALSLPSPNAVVTGLFNHSMTTDIINNGCPYQVARTDEYLTARLSGWLTPGLIRAQNVLFLTIGVFIVLGIVAFKVVSEFFQLCNAQLGYLGWENMMEWILYILSILFVIPLSGCRSDQEIQGVPYHIYREPWQYQVGVIATFLAWMELVLFIRKLPRFGIYVVMFTHILQTFLQFFLVFFLFLIGFAISFHMVFANQTPFNSVESSLLKTAIMMIGEFEFDSIFNESEGNDPTFVIYPEAAYLLFVISVIIMSIIIMNLLVGLAVDDIKGVQDQATLSRMAMQVELALTVESMLPQFITRKRMLRQLKVKPNARLGCCGGATASIIAGMAQQNLAAALNPELEDIEKVMEQQENLERQVAKLNSRTKELKATNGRLESMLTALLKHQGVNYSDQDGAEEEEDINVTSLFS